MPLVSVVIPSYRRCEIVLATIEQFRRHYPDRYELIIVDQTDVVPTADGERMASLDADGSIRWLRLSTPSIPAAMNTGLLAASGEIVLFLDDDIELDEKLVPAHEAAQRDGALVAGQVLQPGEYPVRQRAGQTFLFCSDSRRWISEFMGGNFSVNRSKALSLGGFDENFVGAAFRFEAEFAHRFVARHGKILFCPDASIRHLRLSSGGTRAHGHHLRTVKPAHTVGAYYYLLRVRPRHWFRKLVARPLRSVRTRHHMRRPWWIPLTLFAELRGFLHACGLLAAGPKLISPRHPAGQDRG